MFCHSRVQQPASLLALNQLCILYVFLPHMHLCVCVSVCVYVKDKSLRKHLPLVVTSVPEHESPLISKPKANIYFLNFMSLRA